jgi:hypothetical protein
LREHKCQTAYLVGEVAPGDGALVAAIASIHECPRREILGN